MADCSDFEVKNTLAAAGGPGVVVLRGFGDAKQAFNIVGGCPVGRELGGARRDRRVIDAHVAEFDAGQLANTIVQHPLSWIRPGGDEAAAVPPANGANESLRSQRFECFSSCDRRDTEALGEIGLTWEPFTIDENSEQDGIGQPLLDDLGSTRVGEGREHGGSGERRRSDGSRHGSRLEVVT